LIARQTDALRRQGASTSPLNEERPT
jgi:hypothetical protein